MAADVGSLIRIMGNYSGDDHSHRRLHPFLNRTAASDSGDESTALITRDFLGGSSSTSRVEAQELDLDMEVPSGYEKRLDLKSGRVYLKRCNSPNPPIPSSSSEPPEPTNTQQQTAPKLQDLNFPPSKPSLNLFEDACLDLKLFPALSSSSSSASQQCNYQSVCTLDKVKSALERAERHTTKNNKQGSSKSSSPPAPAPAPSSSLIKEMEKPGEEGGLPSVSSPALFAAGCPTCLLYVLISKNNPKCPRCHTVVPVPTITNPTPAKKPKLDLNISSV